VRSFSLRENGYKAIVSKRGADLKAKKPDWKCFFSGEAGVLLRAPNLEIFLPLSSQKEE
jgi:hypothetical protein